MYVAGIVQFVNKVFELVLVFENISQVEIMLAWSLMILVELS